MYINDTPETPGVFLGLFAHATDSMFSEIRSELSELLRYTVSAGTQKSMKIRLRPSTFLIDLGPLMPILH
jgi:hypothetical protein